MAPSDRSRCDHALFGAPGRFRSGLALVYHSCAIEQPELHKTKQIRQRRFRTLVLVGSVGMEPVETTARVAIDHGGTQVVSSEKPIECTRRPCRPLPAAIGLCRDNAGRNRCCRLDRLLIECRRLLAVLTEAVGPDRAETP